jgi:hypothetical protein
MPCNSSAASSAEARGFSLPHAYDVAIGCKHMAAVAPKVSKNNRDRKLRGRLLGGPADGGSAALKHRIC